MVSLHCYAFLIPSMVTCAFCKNCRIQWKLGVMKICKMSPIYQHNNNTSLVTFGRGKVGKGLETKHWSFKPRFSNCSCLDLANSSQWIWNLVHGPGLSPDHALFMTWCPPLSPLLTGQTWAEAPCCQLWPLAAHGSGEERKQQSSGTERNVTQQQPYSGKWQHLLLEFHKKHLL